MLRKQNLKLFRKFSCVVGCSVDTEIDVSTRCFLFTKSILKRNYCFYSCKNSSDLLVGNKYRYCEEKQRWSGDPPRCVSRKFTSFIKEFYFNWGAFLFALKFSN